MTFEAYKIGIKISLINHVSTGLAMMGRDFMKTEAQAALLEKRIKSIQSQALKGGLMFGAGAAGIMLFKGPLEEAKKFEQQMGKFKLFGMSDAQNTQAVSFAKNMNIMGSSIRENMKIMTEAQGVFRESGLSGNDALGGAKLAAPYLAKINFAASTLDPGSAAKLMHSNMAMLRYVEMSGGLASPQKFKELANAGWKLSQTSGGAVDFEQLRQFKARAGVSGQYLSEEGMAMMEPIIAELKGSTAGFATKTAFNRLNGIIKIPNQVAHELVKAGVWDGSKVQWNSMGGIKAFKGNPMRDSAMMMHSPVEFYEKYIKPVYDKQNLSPEERGRKNAMFFGATGGAEYTLIDKQLATIHHSLESYRKALGIDESYGTAKGTLAGKELDLHAKWKDLMLQLGNTILPMAISAMNRLIPALKSMTEWMRDNKTIVKGLVVGFIGLAGVLMFGGIVTGITVAFRGLGLALAFTGIGGLPGIAGLAARFVVLGVAMKTAFGWVSALALAGAAGYAVGGVINKHLPQGVANAIGSGLVHISAMLGNKDAQDAVATQDKYTRSQAQASGQIRHIHHVTLVADGKVLAKVVQENSKPSPSRGATGLNPISHNLIPSGSR
jgi:hypothetical protein